VTALDRVTSGRSPVWFTAARLSPVGLLDVLYLSAVVCAIVLGTGAQMLLAVPLTAAVGVRVWARRHH
jgi:hypothetical protein